jgi:hypothetical protein
MTHLRHRITYHEDGTVTRVLICDVCRLCELVLGNFSHAAVLFAARHHHLDTLEIRREVNDAGCLYPHPELPAVQGGL